MVPIQAKKNNKAGPICSPNLNRRILSPEDKVFKEKDQNKFKKYNEKLQSRIQAKKCFKEKFYKCQEDNLKTDIEFEDEKPQIQNHS